MLLSHKWPKNGRVQHEDWPQNLEADFIAMGNIGNKNINELGHVATAKQFDRVPKQKKISKKGFTTSDARIQTKNASIGKGVGHIRWKHRCLNGPCDPLVPTRCASDLPKLVALHRDLFWTSLMLSILINFDELGSNDIPHFEVSVSSKLSCSCSAVVRIFSISSSTCWVVFCFERLWQEPIESVSDSVLFVTLLSLFLFNFKAMQTHLVGTNMTCGALILMTFQQPAATKASKNPGELLTDNVKKCYVYISTDCVMFFFIGSN